jgi:hypothetical protein
VSTAGKKSGFLIIAAPLFFSLHAKNPSEEWTEKSRGRQAFATPNSTPKKMDFIVDDC